MAKKDKDKQVNETPAAEEASVNEAAEAAEKTMEEYLTIENESLIEENDALHKEKDELVETLQRHQAEFDNFRRRTLKEKDDIRKNGCADLITELLPVLDNFERAISHGKDDPLVQGVVMVQKQFMEILAKSGLAEVGAVGDFFDPNLHNAVAKEAGGEADTIMEVLQKGYTLHEKLLRPAMVKVAE